MIKPLTATVRTVAIGAALVTGFGILATVAVLDARADAAVTISHHGAKADRLPAPVRLCLLHGWPNYEPGCQFDLRQPANEFRPVRIITLR